MGLYYLGRIYAEMKSYEKAKQYFLKTLAIEPNMISALLDLGVTYEIQNEPEKAVEVYQKILNLDPDNKRARQRLGQIFIKNKKLDKALDQLKELQKFDSEDLNIRTKMGLIYMEQGNLDQAILEFNFVLAAHPKDEDRVRYYLGAAYVEKEAFDQAISEFKKIPPESDIFSDSRKSILLILRKQNKIEEAIRVMEESIRIKPNEGEFYLILAGLFENENQLQKSLDTLKKGLDKNKEDLAIRFQLGAIYDKLGDFDKMVTEMKEVLRLNPDHADALNYLGYSYADRGVRLEEALHLIQKAMTLKPNMGYITDSLGWVYFKLGEYEKAAAELEKANQLTPDDPLITEHLADSYSKLNRVEKTIEFYEKAQKLDPKPDQMERLKNKIKELGEKKK